MTVSMRSRAKLERKRVSSKKPRNIARLQGRLFHPNKAFFIWPGCSATTLRCPAPLRSSRHRFATPLLRLRRAWRAPDSIGLGQQKPRPA
jgi:hypothetical protein